MQAKSQEKKLKANSAENINQKTGNPKVARFVAFYCRFTTFRKYVKIQVRVFSLKCE